MTPFCSMTEDLFGATCGALLSWIISSIFVRRPYFTIKSQNDHKTSELIVEKKRLLELRQKDPPLCPLYEKIRRYCTKVSSTLFPLNGLGLLQIVDLIEN